MERSKLTILLVSIALCVISAVVIITTWILLAKRERDTRVPAHQLFDIVSAEPIHLLTLHGTPTQPKYQVEVDSVWYTTFKLQGANKEVSVAGLPGLDKVPKRPDGHRARFDATTGALTFEKRPVMIPVTVTPLSQMDAVSEATPVDEIPPIMIQSYKLDDEGRVPVGMVAAMNTWKTNNPDFLHCFADDQACRGFIAQRFPKRVLDAYDTLVPGAFKSDFWRYCILYELGGYYADVKSLCQPGWKLDRTADLVLVKDLWHPMNTAKNHIGSVYNAFMGVRKNHPIMRRAIWHVVGNVERRWYGPRTLSITGPWALGTVFDEEYTAKKLQIGTRMLRNSENKVDTVILYEHISNLFLLGRARKIDDVDRNTKFMSEYPMYREDQQVSSGPRYCLLWKQRKAFTSSSPSVSS